MSNYQTPITIREALSNIEAESYLLPSIQREFVWSQTQIETLFDSLMRGYPIGTFLFWSVDQEGLRNFQFYRFIKNYHERDCYHNEKVKRLPKDTVTAILDGQQRLTSLYIGLMGSYAAKLPYYRVKSDHAYPVKRLYLNLFNRLEDHVKMQYEFKFLTEKEASKVSNDCFWFPCQTILKLDDMSKVAYFLMQNNLMDSAKYSQEQREFAMNTLNSFYNIIHQKGVISAYVERDSKLDKVLQIFIRINSGGTKLSYSDLLLSIATAQWQERDAREEIHQLVDEINQIGVGLAPSGFNFNKDFILKSCLVLSDLDVKFQVDNFTKENMRIIENNWENIRTAIINAVQLVANFGFNGRSLTTHNAVIPIANYIYTHQIYEKILDSNHYKSDRKLIRNWLAKVILKGVFGGTPDSVYPVIRRLIKENPNGFPLQAITEYYRGHQRSILFDAEEIEALLELQYGERKMYALLLLLYPSLNHNFIYQQDHLHPRFQFNKKHYQSLGFTDHMMEMYDSNRDSLANIQLLPSTQNQEKSSLPLLEWVEQTFPNIADRRHFLREHHLSEDVALDFESFLTFIENRQQYLRAALKNILNVH